MFLLMLDWGTGGGTGSGGMLSEVRPPVNERLGRISLSHHIVLELVKSLRRGSFVVEVVLRCSDIVICSA